MLLFILSIRASKSIRPNMSLMVAFLAREKRLFGVEFRKNITFRVHARRRDPRQREDLRAHIRRLRSRYLRDARYIDGPEHDSLPVGSMLSQRG
jgi:hypothetical protein